MKRIMRISARFGLALVTGLFVFKSLPLYGQAGIIQGIVLDALSGDPIPYANIILKGENRGAVSDKDGLFRISTQSREPVTLIIRHIGYAEKTIQAAPGSTGLKIVLQQSAVSLPEVTITSMRVSSTLRDEPMPVSVIRSARINDAAPFTVSDVLDEAAGLSVARDGIWGTHVVIRGFSKDKIVMLVDGFRIETANNLAAGLSLFDMQDIERVEVIKGAASTLYGSGAMGGVVNITTRQGLFTDGLRVRGKLHTGYQSANQAQTGHLSVTASAERWYMKASGSLRNAENVKTPEGILDNSQFSDQNISLSGGIRIAQNQDLKIQIQHFDAEDVGIPGGRPFPAAASARYPEENRRLYSAEYTIRNASSILPLLSMRIFQQSILRDVELKPNAMAVLRPGADHLTRGGILQSEWRLFGNHTLISGVDIWQRSLNTWRTRHIIPQNRTIGEKPVPNSTYQSAGFFGQNRFPVSESVTMTIGGRLDRIKISSEEAYNPEYVIVDGIRTERPGNNRLWDAQDAVNWSASGYAGLIWNAFKDADITFNAARSFRSPNLEERFQYIELGGAVYWGDPDLKPETGTFFDVGIRIWKPAFTFSANVFYNILSNLVVDGYAGEGVYQKQNIGSAGLTGFDMDWQFRLGKSVIIYGNAAWVYGEDNQLNEPLPEIPPLEARAGIRYALKNLALIDIHIQGADKQARTASGEMETDGYVLLNASVQSGAVSFGGFRGRFILGVDNITNVSYRRHLSTYRGLIRLEPGTNWKAGWVMEL